MDGNRHVTMTVDATRSITAVNRNGVQLTIDPEGELGFSPLELFLTALGSCSAVDLALLMKKQRDPVTPFRVDVDGLKQDMRMQWMRVTYSIDRETDPRKLERARIKTAEDLCTVSRTLSSGCRVEHVVA
jgi:putative redox protein